MTTLARAQRIIDIALRLAPTDQGRDRIEEMQLHDEGYAEPGYGMDEGTVIVTGNFNSIDQWDAEGRTHTTIDNTPARVGELLEKAGVEIEWSDEWAKCDDCGKLVRTVADSYSWSRSYFEDDCHISCHECVQDDPAAYLDHLEGNTSSCMTLDIDLEEHGYRKLADDFQNGLYGGQSADPKLIGQALEEQGVYRYIFTLDSVGQFDMSFSVWVHEDEEVDDAAFHDANHDGADPAKQMQQALANVPPMTSGGDGIQVTQVRGAEAKTKTITPQEFVEGTWLDD